MKRFALILAALSMLAATSYVSGEFLVLGRPTTLPSGAAVGAIAYYDGGVFVSNGSSWSAVGNGSTSAGSIQASQISEDYLWRAIPGTTFAPFPAGDGGVSVTVSSAEALVGYNFTALVRNPGSAGFNAYAAVSISGATNAPASDAGLEQTILLVGGPSANWEVYVARRGILHVNPGTNTFTMEYRRNTASSFEVSNQSLIIYPLLPDAG